MTTPAREQAEQLIRTNGAGREAAVAVAKAYLELIAKNQKMRQTLQWYGDPSIWKTVQPTGTPRDIRDFDGGERARQTLRECQ